MKQLKRVALIFDRVINWLAYLAAGLLGFVCLCVCLYIFLRYVFNTPMQWVLPISEATLVFICFLGTAWLLREEGHVKLDVVLNRLKPRNQALLNMATSILAGIISLIILCYSIQTSLQAYQLGSFKYVSERMNLPLFPLHIIVAVGSFMLFAQFLRKAYASWGMVRHK